ncbi:SAM-dependent methyltransferase [Curtobacterium pusillum]|uniref:SAM-dependent methyltransferase n=1 Tax=Curtobacterium pusillum TaxID=69373 RepID=A0AAW3T851_9MICO|nr:class I SAM-dependent methyltransferase [Curtobacterium pusillum]MBA8990880.1 SAM-dependent methyltransferase [Curtobacterium pusillum]
MTFEQHAQSFGAAADAYEHGRPGYPDEVAAGLVPDGARLVVDVGAGTGKFTRTLVGRAAEVVAVEPDRAMRERLTAVLPGVRALDGTGEAIPLPDGSADAVTFAQAWHWVDPARGSVEVARVLRPGGVLGLVWNVRDETRPWSQRLGALMRQPESRVMDYGAPVVGAPFDDGEYERFHWVHEQERSAFLDMVASRSYVIVRPPAERTALLDAVQRLLDVDPDTAGRDTVPVEYTTHVHRYVRP